MDAVHHSKSEGDSDGRAPEAQLLVSEAEELALALQPLQISEVPNVAPQTETIAHVTHDPAADVESDVAVAPPDEVVVAAKATPQPAEAAGGIRAQALPAYRHTVETIEHERGDAALALSLIHI